MTPELVPHGGAAEPRGATAMPDGVNFSVYSETATAIWVCIFDAQDDEIGRFLLDGHEENVRFGLISGIGPGTRYGLRADGPYDPAQGYYFDPNKLLVDPYAKLIDRTFVRSPRLRLPREAEEDTASLVPKGIVIEAATERLQPRGSDAPGMIYELNVRGYTMRHPSVQGPLRGTVAGLTTRQVISHLEHLGVDVVELMPVAAWIDEGHLPILGLTNAWGYNPITYFAPDPRLMPRGLTELRAMTDMYREHGISVILDVVYNHTGEGDDQGPVLSFKGLDAHTYYRHVEVDGSQVLVNDTGTGNTLRCDHPEVQRLVIDSLRHWVEECGVSGFRFDLAPILGRSLEGFDGNAELIRKIKADPVLSKGLLVAEPWDPGPGGYQLGAFGDPFHEWNDKYRDQVRAFWRGDDDKLAALVRKVAGTSDVFDHNGRRPSAGINFLAVHDGFTLMDLVSYEDKHNEANGEENRDGHNHNSSWNCGVEGPIDDPEINAARARDIRAMLATLMFSRGVPMLQQGDEMGRSQQGNNNAYAQDNEITWLDWENADGELVNYVAALKAFRDVHPALSADRFLTGEEQNGVRDVVWLHPEGREMDDDDWHDAGASVIGMHLHVDGDELIIWFNRWVDAVDVSLPEPTTGNGWASGICSSAEEPAFGDAGLLSLPSRSVVAIVPAEA